MKKWKCVNLGPKMSYLQIFALEFENYIIIFEISVPSNLCNWKILWNYENASIWEWKCLNLVLKMPYLGDFGLEIWKTIVIFEISTFTHTVNFGIGSAFPKGLGSSFFEGPGPGPGPLYKVCRCKVDLK